MMLHELHKPFKRYSPRRVLTAAFFLWAGLLALASCQSQPGASPVAPTATQVEPLAGGSQTSPSPTPTVYFTLTPTPVVAGEDFLPVENTPTPTPVPHIAVCSPLEDHTLADMQEIITFPYDPPPVGKDTGHHGIDFAYYRRGERLTILGVPVQSVLAGRVAAAINNRPPYGNMVIVETMSSSLPDALRAMLELEPGESLYLLYAHMQDAPLVGMGDDVLCGQALGAVGNTPPEWSSAPHLHLEARLGPAGAVFSEMAFYTAGSTDDERFNYTRWRTRGEFRLIDPWRVLEFGFDR